jgi:hypothetical protein
MVSSQATTVKQYIAELDPKHAIVIEQVRQLVNKNLPKGYEEVMQYGMISWVIPLKVFPNTYNKQPLASVSLARQKHYFALYLNCLYMNTDMLKQFEQEYSLSGKKLDMGKSCLRFKKFEDLNIDSIAQYVSHVSVAHLIDYYQKSREVISK